MVVQRSYPGPNTILLRAGTYYLQQTIQLNTLDYGLTIANYAGKILRFSALSFPFFSVLLFFSFSFFPFSLFHFYFFLVDGFEIFNR